MEQKLLHLSNGPGSSEHPIDYSQARSQGRTRGLDPPTPPNFKFFTKNPQPYFDFLINIVFGSHRKKILAKRSTTCTIRVRRGRNLRHVSIESDSDHLVGRTRNRHWNRL